ncbi:hypothetical protein OESDEN_15656 [Oesophagostomum dentatum]|uniref:Uncharacterized protein n=1 Tax=Oesophagostomum dentatum TaxID=61180 RepID=A0A0B1SH61_OESDE|nr:hypothetical protein OESDEN_15656 [Oesophagostomum dentatum]
MVPIMEDSQVMSALPARTIIHMAMVLSVMVTLGVGVDIIPVLLFVISQVHFMQLTATLPLATGTHHSL